VGLKTKLAIGIAAGLCVLGAGAAPAGAAPAYSATAEDDITFTTLDGTEVTCTVRGTTHGQYVEDANFTAITVSVTVDDDALCRDAATFAYLNAYYRRSDEEVDDTAVSSTSSYTVEIALSLRDTTITRLGAAHRVDFACRDATSGEATTCPVVLTTQAK
jgi:hypothetical protein